MNLFFKTVMYIKDLLLVIVLLGILDIIPSLEQVKELSIMALIFSLTIGFIIVMLSYIGIKLMDEHELKEALKDFNITLFAIVQTVLQCCVTLTVLYYYEQTTLLFWYIILNIISLAVVVNVSKLKKKYS